MPAFANALREDAINAIEPYIQSNAEFRAELESYFERFGDRCLDELKLESQTVADDPLPLLRAVGQLARTVNKQKPNTTMEQPRAIAEAKVRQNLSGSPLRQCIFSWILKLACFVYPQKS